MWRLCFFVLTLLFSYGCAQIEVGQTFVEVMNARQPDSACQIIKWSDAPLAACSITETMVDVCDSYKQTPLGQGRCGACMFLCVSNARSCDFLGHRVERRKKCRSKISAVGCQFYGWSSDRGSINCTGATVTVRTRNGLERNPDESPYYTCMEEDCNVCSKGQVYHDEEVPCQKMCDNSPPKCQLRPKPGCGCRSDQYWDGRNCVDECEECPPGVARVLCDEDACAGMKCYNHGNAVCKASTCGGCHGKFYLNGNPLSSAECNVDCEWDYWVQCGTAEAIKCPVCTNGCKCIDRLASVEDLGRKGRRGCWRIYDCSLPPTRG